MRKRLLYIGHDHHLKTRSTAFLQELLATRYDVENLSLAPGIDSAEAVLALAKRRQYDAVVVFQVMPSIKTIRRRIRFKYGAFFPMYDYYEGCKTFADPVWAEYKDMRIINFGRAVHEDMLRRGYHSRYIQYFPPPPETVADWGDPRAAYLWQRITHLNAYTMRDILPAGAIDRLHLHMVPDPEHQAVDAVPADFPGVALTRSVWYEDRAAIDRDLERAGLYVAPRFAEGIGQTFLEAMARGRCVVAPDRPTMSEYIRHGENGLLYPLTGEHRRLPELGDVRAMQRQARADAEAGRAAWLRDAPKILDWLVEPLVIDRKRVKAALRSVLPRVSLKRRIAGAAAACVRPLMPARMRQGIRRALNTLLNRDGPFADYRLCLFGRIPLIGVKYRAEPYAFRFCLFGFALLSVEERP